MKYAIAPLLIALALGACAPTPSTPIKLAPDGKPLPRVYRITAEDEGQIQYRMLDAINVLRSNKNLEPVTLDARLTAAAATHARDIARQNRPWHFGSDGSSPIDRVRRVGYTGHLVGETLSETYETELETLTAWMKEPTTRGVILDPNARDMGFAWFQEPSAKLWWVLTLGGPSLAPEADLLADAGDVPDTEAMRGMVRIVDSRTSSDSEAFESMIDNALR